MSEDGLNKGNWFCAIAGSHMLCPWARSRASVACLGHTSSHTTHGVPSCFFGVGVVFDHADCLQSIHNYFVELMHHHGYDYIIVA